MSGAGDTITPMIISLVTTVAIRVPLAYTIAHFTKSETLPAGSPDSLFISLLISWVIGALLSCFFYRFGRWHKKAHEFVRTTSENSCA